MHPQALPHTLELTERRPLLLDTRPLPAFLQVRIECSTSMSSPPLILKRVRKPGAGFKPIDALRPYITTEPARAIWDDLLATPGKWDGNVVIFDDEMDEADMSSPAWILFAVLQSALPLPGTVSFLRSRFHLARSLPDLALYIDSSDSPPRPESARIAVNKQAR